MTQAETDRPEPSTIAELLQRLRGTELVTYREAADLAQRADTADLLEMLDSEHEQTLTRTLRILSARPRAQVLPKIASLCEGHTNDEVRSYAFRALLRYGPDGRKIAASLALRSPTRGYVVALHESTTDPTFRPTAASLLSAIALCRDTTAEVRQAAALKVVQMGWATGCDALQDCAAARDLAPMMRWCKLAGHPQMSVPTASDPLGSFLPDFAVEAMARFRDAGANDAAKIEPFMTRQRETCEARLAEIAVIKQTAARIGRNDLCFCGSGRKFKSCHRNEVDDAALEESTLRRGNLPILGFAKPLLDMPRETWLATCRILLEGVAGRLSTERFASDYLKCIAATRLGELGRPHEALRLGLDILTRWDTDDSIDYPSLLISLSVLAAQRAQAALPRVIPLVIQRLGPDAILHFTSLLIDLKAWSAIDLLLQEALAARGDDLDTLLMAATAWIVMGRDPDAIEHMGTLAELLSDCLRPFASDSRASEAIATLGEELYSARITPYKILTDDDPLAAYWRCNPDKTERTQINNLRAQVSSLEDGLHLGCNEAALDESAREAWANEKAYRSEMLADARRRLKQAVADLLDGLEPVVARDEKLLIAYDRQKLTWMLPAAPTHDSAAALTAAFGALARTLNVEPGGSLLELKRARIALTTTFSPCDLDLAELSKAIIDETLQPNVPGPPSLEIVPLGLLERLPPAWSRPICDLHQTSEALDDGTSYQTLARAFEAAESWRLDSPTPDLGEACSEATRHAARTRIIQPEAAPPELDVYGPSASHVQKNGAALAPTTDETPNVGAAAALDHDGMLAGRSPYTALERASLDHHDVLWVWDSARTSARASYFNRPNEVFRALRALADLAREVRAARREKRPTGPWQDFLRVRGLQYKPHESESTMDRYGEHRSFTTAGRRMPMQKHVTLGGGGNCIQIYFELAEGRLAIGYCGPHLPYATQRT